jgi:hypothetical protein
MTRKEQIQSAAETAYPYYEGTKGMICAGSIPIFTKGAEWADEHPSEETREEMLDDVCKWLKENIDLDHDYPNSVDELIRDLKMAFNDVKPLDYKGRI